MPRRRLQKNMGSSHNSETHPVSETTSRKVTSASSASARDEHALQLYTPDEAAALLRLRPSWLKRKASGRAIPCRFLGKHLRFSHSDLETIAQLDR